ncbi:MAG: thiol peroxidase [Victivallaceae bacterium]|nr:thiol peroxidase [Victivallaceae bacterium]
MENKTAFKGTPVNLSGKFVTPGMKAPDFSLVGNDLGRFAPAYAKGKKLLLNIFPSLDTPVCSLSVRKFNQLAAQMKDTLVLCISKDLPFAQSRFCGAEGIENVTTLSDFHYASHFGTDYGVLMTDGPLSGLLARAVVIVDANGNIAYSQLVPEIVNEPDYDAAIEALAKC